MKYEALDERLMWAASHVRKGARFADVGTDHAYLPIYLENEGRVSFSVASDVNDKPYRRAVTNVAVHGLKDKITVVLSDGIKDFEKYNLSDIALCGMGGLSICEILENAPFIKRVGVRLILQPMTDLPFVRRYLADNGFKIADEKVIHLGERFYQCICADFDGEKRSISPLIAEVGSGSVSDEVYRNFILHKISVLNKSVTGKKSAGIKSEEDEILLRELKELAETKS